MFRKPKIAAPLQSRLVATHPVRPHTVASDNTARRTLRQTSASGRPIIPTSLATVSRPVHNPTKPASRPVSVAAKSTLAPTRAPGLRKAISSATLRSNRVASSNSVFKVPDVPIRQSHVNGQAGQAGMKRGVAGHGRVNEGEADRAGGREMEEMGLGVDMGMDLDVVGEFDEFDLGLEWGACEKGGIDERENREGEKSVKLGEEHLV
jgi:hypothetical protein